MLVELDSRILSPDDFEQRYHSTFGIYDGKLIKVQGCNEDYVSFVAAEGQALQFHLNWDAGNVIQFPTLTQGWRVDSDGRLFHLSRQARRQYRRGISEHNAHITTDRYEAVRFSIDVLKKLLLLAPAGNERFISRNFIVDAHDIVMAQQTKIGVRRGNELYVASLFVQEVRDAVRRSGRNYGVVQC